jgi:hypothetical protein
MSTALILALIAIAGSLASTVVATFGLPAIQAKRDSKKILDTYREPLIAASFELQSRLYNILSLDFVGKWVKDERTGKRDAAIHSTLYVFAQFFAWRELIRREVQYLRFSRDEQTRIFAQLLRDIGEEFLADRYGQQFMIWRVEQRGLGERMIVPADGGKACLGYAAFLDQRGMMDEWLNPIERDLENIDDGGRKRLTNVQHLLVDLIRQLDDNKKRYPFAIDKA